MTRKKKKGFSLLGDQGCMLMMAIMMLSVVLVMAEVKWFLLKYQQKEIEI